MNNVLTKSFLLLGATAIMSMAAINEPFVQNMIDNAYYQQTNTTIFKNVEDYRFNEIKSEIEKHLTEEDNYWFDMSSLKYFLENVDQNEYKNSLKDKTFYQNELVNLMSYLEEIKTINKEELESELADVASETQPYLEFDKSKQYYVETSENTDTNESDQLQAEQTEALSEEVIIPIKNIAQLRSEQRERELSLKLAEIEPMDFNFDFDSIVVEEKSPNDKIILINNDENKTSLMKNLQNLRQKNEDISENIDKKSMKL